MFDNRNNDGRQITIVMKKLQRQDGSANCGLFAIDVMTLLAHKDPSAVTYDQNKMRRHLLECFSTKLVTPFPKFISYVILMPLLWSVISAKIIQHI